MNAASPSAAPRALDRPTRAGRPRHAMRAMLLSETRLFLREPASLIWGFAIPVIAFIVLACIPGLHHPIDAFGGASGLAVYQPVILLFAPLMLALAVLPTILASYRERGVLRRLQTTPMPPIRLLAALLVIHLAVAVLAAAAIVITGAVAGLGVASQFLGWLIAYLLTVIALLSLGVLIAALVPNSKIANGVGVIVTFPLLFFAGLWIPLPTMPHTLQTISYYTPLGAAVRSMTDAVAGHWPPVAALATLLGYAVVFCWLAARYFRW